VKGKDEWEEREGEEGRGKKGGMVR